MMNGCIRALNMQMKALKYALFAYWIVNMGFIKLLSFYYDFGFLGIRLSMLSAQIFTAIAYTVLVKRADW